MKKTLSIALILILLLALPFSALAKEELRYQPAEDLQSVACSDGSIYYAVDLSKTNFPDQYEEIGEKEIILKNTILGKPIKISGDLYGDRLIISLLITFDNGSTFSCNYMQKEQAAAFNALANASAEKLTIEFDSPSDNSLEAATALLKGERCNLSREELEWSEYFYCHATDPKVPLKVRAGALLVIKEQFYFVDFSEITQEDPSWFSPFEYEQLSAYKIADPTLLSELKSGFARNTYGDFAAFGNKDVLELLHWILLSILLFFLPLVGFIICLIFSLRPATLRRKVFLIIAIGLGAELIGFLIYFIVKIL